MTLSLSDEALATLDVLKEDCQLFMSHENLAIYEVKYSCIKHCSLMETQIPTFDNMIKCYYFMFCTPIDRVPLCVLTEIIYGTFIGI